MTPGTVLTIVHEIAMMIIHETLVMILMELS